MQDTAKSRRIFFSSENNIRQLCTVAQNQSDSSIYFSSPNFENINWLAIKLTSKLEPVLLTFKSDTQGKLSLHGSGVTHVRPHNSYGTNEFSISGAALKDPIGETLGIRHLVTLFISEPNHIPSSPANARKTDYIITTKTKQPYILIFWAVPLQSIATIEINGSFHIDDIESVPPDAGWGGFSLLSHGIIWFAYKTKHMNTWPLSTQACYLDGSLVPMFIGTAAGAYRLEVKQPKYSLTGSELKISL